MIQAKVRGFEGPSGTGNYQGYEAVDLVGDGTGRVEEVFSDGNGGTEYVRVRPGLFLRKPVPVQDVALDRAARSLTLE